MAREQRHDVDYFPHDCNHGRKMHIIETKYGNDGYAVWFKLLEQLGKANYHFIDISDDMNFMFLTSVFKVEEDKLVEILKDLSRLGAINQDLYENHKILFSEKFVNSVEDAYKKRKSGPLSPEEILKKLKKEKTQSSTETIQSESETPEKVSETPEKGINPPEVIPKGKKRKEKERKGEKNTREKSRAPSVAFELLKIEKTEELNIFEMQNKKQVKEWQDMIDNFNDTVEIEISKGKIDFEADQLLPRLRKWTRSWLRNQNNYQSESEKVQSTAPERF